MQACWQIAKIRSRSGVRGQQRTKWHQKSFRNSMRQQLGSLLAFLAGGRPMHAQTDRTLVSSATSSCKSVAKAQFSCPQVVCLTRALSPRWGRAGAFFWSFDTMQACLAARAPYAPLSSLPSTLPHARMDHPN